MNRQPGLALMRRGFTLFELLVVCAVIGIATAIAVPRMRATLDSLAVEGAAREVANALALGRFAALRYGGADVRLDSTSMTVHAGGRTLLVRDVARSHRVQVRATTDLVRYAATGLATGLSNGSIILMRGARADTLFVSRLGRVRR